MNEEELYAFLDRWAEETTENDLCRLDVFIHKERKHCRYQEGDIFRFRFDRKYYGYGQILMDVRSWIKSGGKFWDCLMGRPVCISVFHIVTENPDIDKDELLRLQRCPSEYIMDNVFYYGEYEVVASVPADDSIEMPIMYGRSIDAMDPDKVIYCAGKVYREAPYDQDLLFEKDFTNNSIGFSMNVNKKVVEECINTKSNVPYWEQNDYARNYNLQHPANAEYLRLIRDWMKV